MKTCEYKLLLAEMDKIAEKVKMFPEALQEPVYKLLLEALLDSNVTQVEETTYSSDGGVTTEKGDINVYSVGQDYTRALKQYYVNYDLENSNDMEFATFVTYFFTREVPESIRVEQVGDKQYEEACRITGRRMPKRVSGALNNAKNVRGYLTRVGMGVYALSDAGEKFVTEKLLKGGVRAMDSK